MLDGRLRVRQVPWSLQSKIYRIQSSLNTVCVLCHNYRRCLDRKGLQDVTVMLRLARLVVALRFASPINP